MDENRYRGFILNNELAAVSAVQLENSTLATDGFECLIHSFELDGTFIESEKTVRAYRRLRSDNCGEYTALGCCNSARIYFLNQNFIETEYVNLDTSRRNSCGCSDMCELTDASLTVIGSEKFIVGAFRRSAYLFDLNGRRLTRLCETEDGELLTDFIYPGNDLFAMSTLCGNQRTVTVSDNGKVQSAILERGHTLRMLIPQSDGIYGLFGRSYIYNRIIRIYSNGVLTLPRS